VTGRFAGERAVVVGLGSSGRASAEALLAEGASVVVTDSRPAADARASAEAPAGAELLAGGHLREHLDGATLVVTSPGVPERAEFLRWARERRLPLWSELELGARLCAVPFVAITGTNGKTTTVELVAAAMRAAGLRARACGNVGYPFSAAAREPYEALAVEASSFQLRFTETFRPRVSVLLNLAPDHLDWHGSFDAYSRAKARVFANQTGDDVHVGNADDARSAEVSRGARCAVRWFREGPPGPGQAGVAQDGRIVARAPGWGARADGTEPDVDMGRPGFDAPRFLADAAAAAAAALAFGLPAKAVTEAMSSFDLLPHRGEPVGRIAMVRYLDDSKATNPHAAVASLRGLDHVVLIAGGLAKGVDLSPLAAAIPALDGVVAIGEAGPAVVDVFEGRVPVVLAGSIEEAVERASEMARPGGSVVLAPACASMDMFRDYQERGERFAAAVRSLAARAGRAHAN
jgi:UDP-N-acetylmuramoylalanine--D-glutamate ligase